MPTRHCPVQGKPKRAFYLWVLASFVIGLLLGQFLNLRQSPAHKSENAQFPHQVQMRLSPQPKPHPAQSLDDLKRQPARDSTEIVSLRNQITALRKAVSEDETLRKHIVACGGVGLLGLSIGDDFAVSADLADFMELTEQQRDHIKTNASRFLESVKTWETSHAVVVEEDAGKVLSYKLPSSDATLSQITKDFTNDLKETVGQRNYSMVEKQIISLIAEFNRERIVTYYTIPGEEGETAYQFSVEWTNAETGTSGGSDEAGAVLPEIPTRWQHLFKIESK